jgi:hypothetical protein
MKYNLPSRDGALVVVTTTKNKEILEKARIWRALSSDDRIGEDWQTTSRNIFQKLVYLISRILRNLKRIFIRH